MGESGPGRTRLSPAARLAGWSALHSGLDPATVPLLRGWLRAVWFVARSLRAVPPMALTVLGAVLAVDALLLASAQPWTALALVLVATGCDALDGAVALETGRATPTGARADRIADRIADTAFAFVIWRCGAPWPLAVAAAALSLGHELWREVRGGPTRSRITVAERPTRVICTVLACGCAGLSSATWPPAVCAAVWVTLAVVGLAQLVRA
jgi:phosphatidylglycerophosphate synthase